MPSPFPGMDPFIEGQSWRTFHSLSISAMTGLLTHQVRPNYIVDVEERVYIEHHVEDWPASIGPDLRLLGLRSPSTGSQGVTSVMGGAIAPLELTVPVSEPQRETYLTVRRRGVSELVTVIEVLSPTNKRPGSDGRSEYLQKRDAVLHSRVHLVELDLLRGGARLPTIEDLPSGDYFAFVCRGNRRPKAEVYAWSLQQRLPTIPIPLAGDDADVGLDLQAVLDQVYDLAGFDYALDYTTPLEPPVSETDAAWLRQWLDPDKPPKQNL